MKPGKVILNQDTLPGNSAHVIPIKRSKTNLIISATNSKDSIETIQIPYSKSSVYFLNFCTPFWVGLLIDQTNPKRFGYPNSIYLLNNQAHLTYSSVEPLEETERLKKNILKIAPLNTINVINPRFDISIERQMNEFVSLEGTFAPVLPISVLTNNLDIKQNLRGFEVAIEARIYLKGEMRGWYAGFEKSYLKNKYRSIWSFGQYDDNGLFTGYEEEYGIERKINSSNLKFGYQWRKNTGFVTTLELGIGVRNKDISHFDRLNEEDVMYVPRHPNVHHWPNIPGKFTEMTIPLSLKIGHTF